ncbi:phytanoyl-CoA dioxygenase family protein [Xylogone sp. PMI_703]|nr:phytanoyl-CoA dioxygenase family protein [Xylogone sp. PMI_703]
MLNKHSEIVTNRLFDFSTAQIEEFKEKCGQTTDHRIYPLASLIEKNIPIYKVSDLEPLDPTTSSQLQNEWHHILYHGPGVFVLNGMYGGTRQKQLSEANAAFQKIIERERQSATVKGDHFAASGKNDRIWNSFSKHGLENPVSFVEYYSNPWLALVSEAWLGPGYRITAQVNIVKPGGAAQESHRDYHLGFQTIGNCAAYPRPLQIATQFLTLQGAVAHSDMPLESGPTRFLPFSQTYDAGYMTWRNDEFRQYFLDNYVSLPLKMGDGVFFNPAIFHAAGANTTDPKHDFHRKANLLQISAAFGKTMEVIDTIPLIDRCWDLMLRCYREEHANMQCFVQAVAEGYPFPTNLDKRPPAPSGMAPESEQEVIMRGLKEQWSREKIVTALRQMRVDSCSL